MGRTGLDEFLKPGSAASEFIRQHGSSAKREVLRKVLRARKEENIEAEAYYRRILEEILASDDCVQKSNHLRPHSPKQ